jgi:hypothetical protein
MKAESLTAKSVSERLGWSTAVRVIVSYCEAIQMIKCLKHTTLHLVDNRVRPIWNVMASIPGTIRDEVVLIGCHHDSWVSEYYLSSSLVVHVFCFLRSWEAWTPSLEQHRFWKLWPALVDY